MTRAVEIGSGKDNFPPLWNADCTYEGANVSRRGVQGQMIERRATCRYDLTLPVIIRAQKTQRNGKTRDVSTRGVYFVIDHDMAAGANLDITLTLPSEVTGGAEVFIRAMGKVVRVDKKPKNGSLRVGVAAVIERYIIIRNEPVSPLRFHFRQIK